MRTSVPPIEILRARKKLFDGVRSFFDGRSFLEVDTPIVVPSPGMEPHLLAFETKYVEASGGAQDLYLHTSPEYAMKRLLGHGSGHIYQIAKVFRDEPVSNTHNPEFSMLEFYRCPGSLEEIMDDVEALLLEIAKLFEGPWKPTAVERLSVSEAFTRAGLVDPFDYPETEAFRASLDIRTHEDDDWEDIFHRAMMERVEPSFSAEVPTILHSYPVSMAALSRVDPKDPRKCLRFEVYAGTLELANAFGELTDPQEQRARFQTDQKIRKKFGRPLYPIDEDFLSDLGQIPEASGIALGLDRLLMLCLGKRNLGEVIPFAPKN